MRRIIINTLTKLGYKECHEAGNGREGVEKLATTAVDMVITDWNMPEMSGIEFIRAIRSNDATKTLPILMVTTNAAQDDIVEAMKAASLLREALWAVVSDVHLKTPGVDYTSHAREYFKRLDQLLAAA